jgi:putative endonuclease
MQHSVKPSRRAGSALQAGNAAEQLACRYLAARGIRIEARNVRYRLGELDIVARDGATWIFVEVRSRGRRGDAAASIDWRKRGKIRLAARLFLGARFGDHWPRCRFDVILVEDGGVRWLRSAFSAEEDF